MLVSLLAGARKGFVRELIGLASLVAGLVVAAAEYQRAAAWLGRFIHSEELALGVAFLSLFGGVVIAGAMISAGVRKLVREAGIEWVDRLLGAVFGLVRGVVLDAVVLMTLVAFAIKTDAVQRSRLTPYVGVGSQGIARVMPADLRARFQSRFAEFERELVENERRAFEKASPER